MQKEKNIACRHFYDKTGQQVQEAPVILDRSKTSKIRSLIDRAHFYPMLIDANLELTMS